MGGVGREPESEGQDDAEAWKEEVARGREHDLALPDPLVKWGRLSKCHQEYSGPVPLPLPLSLNTVHFFFSFDSGGFF